MFNISKYKECTKCVHVYIYIFTHANLYIILA